MFSSLFQYTLRIAMPYAAICFALIAHPAGLRAEPLPMPTIDFEAQAKVSNAIDVVLRHRKGKLRMDFSIPGTDVPLVGIADLNTKKIVMIVKIPGLDQAEAFELDLSENPGFGQMTGDGRRIGTDTAAGEPCTLWEVTAPQGKAIACIGSDNIVLKTEAEIAGQRQTVLEVTRVNRRQQNDADFQIPAGIKVNPLPKGLKIPGMQ